MSLIETARRNRNKALQSLATDNIFGDLAVTPRPIGPFSGRRKTRIAYPIFHSMRAA